LQATLNATQQELSQAVSQLESVSQDAKSSLQRYSDLRVKFEDEQRELANVVKLNNNLRDKQ
jgi:septation ring formation regulator EzrA